MNPKKVIMLVAFICISMLMGLSSVLPVRATHNPETTLPASDASIHAPQAAATPTPSSYLSLFLPLPLLNAPLAQAQQIEAVLLTRDEIIARAQEWVDAHVPYNQSGYYNGYREDCSGYASYAWGLSSPGLDTVGLGASSVSCKIPKDDLLPGDLVNNDEPGNNGHVLIFHSWADAGHNSYNAYEENPSWGGAHYTQNIPWPFWPGLPGTFSGERKLQFCTSDTVLPDGELTSPTEGSTITSGSVQISGWASDSGSGFQYAQVWASWDGGSTWQNTREENITSSPFSYSWDMCAADVPANAQVALGLDIWDNAGNRAQSPRGWRRFTTNFNCNTGSVFGHVRDSNNMPVVAATVTFRGGGTTVSEVSLNMGQYTFNDVPAGPAVIEARHSGRVGSVDVVVVADSTVTAPTIYLGGTPAPSPTPTPLPPTAISPTPGGWCGNASYTNLIANGGFESGNCQ